MSIFKQIVFYLKNPYELYIRNKLIKLEKEAPYLSDKDFLIKAFRIRQNYDLNLDDPQSFTEKLQWLKLYDRNPKYTMLSDKYLVRNYVKEKIGEKYLIPLIGVWDKPEDIDFSKLPNQFVLKCNHNSGLGMFICEDKKKMNIDSVISNLKKGLEQDYFMYGREWPYKNIKRKIVCEQYLGKGNGRGINDYKFFCFDGTPVYFLVSSDRLRIVKFDYFDINRNSLPFRQGGSRGHFDAMSIKNYDEMVKIASILSEGIPHVRVDLYNIDGKIYFGEMTFFDSSGFERFKPLKWDYEFGKYLILPKKEKN